MARITVEIDDALLGAAAHTLGTHSAEDTVRAALSAAVRGGAAVPPLPRQDPSPLPRQDPPPVPGRPVPPGPPGHPADHPSEFPHPPEIH